MRKTGGQVLDNLYTLTMASAIPSIIVGTVYKKNRPTNSKTEDCVLSFKTGLDGRIQEGNTQSGALTLNIYVPFIDNGRGVKVPNLARITQIETAIEPIFHGWTNGEYLFTIGDMIQSFEDNTIEQSFIYVDLRFTRTSGTFNN